MRVQSLFPEDRLIKLRDVETVLRDFFHEGSCPSRSTIIGWIEEGTLNGMQIGSGRNYYVYESSLDRLMSELRRSAIRAAA